MKSSINYITIRRRGGIGYAASMEDMRNAYKSLVGKPEGKRPFGRCSVDGKII